MAYFLFDHFDHAHAYVDKLAQVDPRFDLHDVNTSSRVDQKELNSN